MPNPPSILADIARAVDEIVPRTPKLLYVDTPQPRDHSFGFGPLPQYGFAGIRIVESDHLYTTVEDWSGVRSPSRARRRLKRGHKQNIVYRRLPMEIAYQFPNGSVVMHPNMASKVRETMRGMFDDDMLNFMVGRHRL